MLLRLLIYFCLCISSVTVFAAEQLASEHPEFSEETLSLAQQYKNLRQQHSHWKSSGWNEKVDKYKSDMHVVMEKLGDIIRQGEYTKSNIIELLGPADAIEQKGKSEQYIYFWRGWHDYLYFTIVDNKVTDSQWYFAYE